MLLRPDVVRIDCDSPFFPAQANIPFLADRLDGKALVSRLPLLAVGGRKSQQIALPHFYIVTLK
ncbi:hypothetical protein D3C81_1998110 [compost metagenome]